MKPIALFLGLALCSAAADPTPIDLNAQAIQLFQQARYPEAEQAYRQALAGWDRMGPAAVASRAVTEGNLGTLFRVEGRYADAQPLLLDWLHESEAAAGPDSISVARASTSLAALFEAQVRLADAEAFALRADAILQRHADEQPAEFADNSRILASIWLDQGRYREGEELLRRLIPSLPERLAVGAYNDLAASALRQGQISQAEPLAMQAVELARRVLPGHPLLATAINNLAQIERFQQRYEEAEKHYREAIETWKHALGSAHPDVAKGWMNLAALYHERGREAGAEDLYRQSVRVF